MKNLRPLVFLLALFLTLSGTETVKAKNNFLLSKQKAGLIEIGMSVDALYSRYKRKSTKLVDLYIEGMFSPALEIYLNDKEEETKYSLVAEIGWGSSSHTNSGFIVSRIQVYDEVFKTEKGIAVGSSLGELRNHYKVNWIEFGEGGLIARINELDMSFVLFLIDIPEEWYMTRDQEIIPDSVKIISIFMN
jgi:hypothetical protein